MMEMLNKLFLKIMRSGNLNKISKPGAASVAADLRLGDFNNIAVHPKVKSLKIDSGANFRNYINIFVGKNAELHLGKRFFMNNYCSVNCLEKIEIGDNTLFGEGVKLYDHNHEYGFNPDFKVEHQKFKTAPIKIGKNCWLGSNVTVLKGVTIGDNCIIGAHCLIYKDVPANTIVKNKTELLIENLR